MTLEQFLLYAEDVSEVAVLVDDEVTQIDVFLNRLYCICTDLPNVLLGYELKSYRLSDMYSESYPYIVLTLELQNGKDTLLEDVVHWKELLYGDIEDTDVPIDLFTGAVSELETMRSNAVTDEELFLAEKYIADLESATINYMTK